MKNPQNNFPNNSKNHPQTLPKTIDKTISQNNPIFREESLERLSSPERLNLFGNNSTNERK